MSSFFFGFFFGQASTAWALAIGLAAARTVPLVWWLPPLGGARVPLPIRLGLGGLVAVLCLPGLLPIVATPPPPSVGAAIAAAAGGVAASAAGVARAGHAGAWVGLGGWDVPTLLTILVREILVGTSLGICAGVAFQAAELAGNLVGASLGTAEPRDLAARVGDLYLLLAIVSFLELGGLGMVAAAVIRSYQTIPVVVAPTAHQARAVAELVVLTVARLWELALMLAAPVVVASWLATLAIALAARVAPELGGAALWSPVRPWVGLAVLLFGIGVFEGDGFKPWLDRCWSLVSTAIAVWGRR